MMKTGHLRRGGFEILPYLVAIIALLLMGNDTFPPKGDPLAPGAYQAEATRFTLPDSAEVVTVDGAVGGQAVRTESIGYVFYSHHDLWVRWRNETPLPDEANMMFTTLGDDGWYTTRMPAPEIFPAGHTVPTQLGDADTPPFLIDSITVIDRTYQRLYPPLAGVIIGVGTLVLVILRALHERRQR